MSQKMDVLQRFFEEITPSVEGIAAERRKRPSAQRASVRRARRDHVAARSLPASARWRAWEDWIASASATPPLFVSGYVAIANRGGRAVLRPTEPRRDDDPAILKLALEFDGEAEPSALDWQKTLFEMPVDPLRYTGVEILSDGSTLVELDIEIVE